MPRPYPLGHRRTKAAPVTLPYPQGLHSLNHRISAFQRKMFILFTCTTESISYFYIFIFHTDPPSRFFVWKCHTPIGLLTSKWFTISFREAFDPCIVWFTEFRWALRLSPSFPVLLRVRWRLDLAMLTHFVPASVICIAFSFSIFILHRLYPCWL